MNAPHDDPNWPRASVWLAGDCFPEPLGTIEVLGAPLNKSITPGRCDLAPAVVRKAMYRLSCYDISHDVDVRSIKCSDRGDLEIASSSPEEALSPIGEAISSSEAEALVLLGGDNGVTRPGVHGLGALDRVGLLTIDAHFDLRDTTSGLTNGNPVRALLDDGMPGSNIVQIGIAPFANSSEYMRVANDAGIKVVPVTTTRHMDLQILVHEYLDFLADRVDVIYVDLDIDVLDRAFAPACPGARPGGLSPGAVIEACYEMGVHPKVKAMDIVEIDPEKDINYCTSLAAGMFLLSFACGLVARCEAAR